MFKSELHVHTSPASNCAHTEPEETIEHYIEHGYSTVVITNHMSPTLFDTIVPQDCDYRQAAEIYLDDYRRAKKYANGRINVLCGMELRVRKNMNDYLIYGLDEQFILNMGNVMDKTIKKLRRSCFSGAPVQKQHDRNRKQVLGRHRSGKFLHDPRLKKRYRRGLGEKIRYADSLRLRLSQQRLYEKRRNPD